MNILVTTKILGSKRAVWAAVSDIELRPDILSGVTALTVLERPESGLVGLKWAETRVMFGQDASETMWITEAEEGSRYSTRAESHGSIYHTRIEVTEVSGEGTVLSLRFDAKPQSKLARVMSLLVSPLITGPTTKALQQDLDDFRGYVESKT